MTKKEFLEGLRAALEGEIPDSEITSNVRFYEDYINSQMTANSESDIISQLGDPRLIAKTIIETYQMAHGPLYNNKNHEKAYQDARTTDGSTYEEYKTYKESQDSYGDSFKIHSSLTWYQKLVIILVTIVVFALIIIIGGLILRLFFMIGVPVLFVYLIYRLFTNNTRK